MENAYVNPDAKHQVVNMENQVENILYDYWGTNTRYQLALVLLQIVSKNVFTAKETQYGT